MKTTEKYKVGQRVKILGRDAKILQSTDGASYIYGGWGPNIDVAYVTETGKIEILNIEGVERIESMIDKE